MGISGSDRSGMMAGDEVGLLLGRLRQSSPRELARLMAAVCREVESACHVKGLQSGPAVDCGPGCAFCCVLNVAALLPEVAAIAFWLTEQLSSPELADLRTRLDKTVARIAWMEEEERISRGISCAFLDGEGSCLIHPVRPLTCRGVTSTDRRRCRQALQGDGEGGPVIMDLRLKEAAEGAFLDLAESLEGLGLDSRSVELMRGVQAFLAEPTLLGRFLAGERLNELHG